MSAGFAILLENGHLVHVAGSKQKARARLRLWKAAYRRAVAENALARPRMPIGLVCFKCKAVNRGASTMGRAGGRARALALSPERRSEIAKAAAKKRWHSRP